MVDQYINTQDVAQLLINKLRVSRLSSRTEESIISYLKCIKLLQHRITPEINDSICDQIQPYSSSILVLLLDPTAELFSKAILMNLDTEDLAQIWLQLSKSEREFAVRSLSSFLDHKSKQSITQVS